MFLSLLLHTPWIVVELKDSKDGSPTKYFMVQNECVKDKLVLALEYLGAAGDAVDERSVASSPK